jgi:hypothetical protein
MLALDALDLTVADRHYLAHRHLKRMSWWVDQLRYAGGDRGHAARSQELTERLMRAALAEVMPDRHDAWTSGVVTGRVAFG